MSSWSLFSGCLKCLQLKRILSQRVRKVPLKEELMMLDLHPLYLFNNINIAATTSHGKPLNNDKDFRWSLKEIKIEARHLRSLCTFLSLFYLLEFAIVWKCIYLKNMYFSHSWNIYYYCWNNYYYNYCNNYYQLHSCFLVHVSGQKRFRQCFHCTKICHANNF